MKNYEFETNVYSKEYAEFITVTCLEWKPLLHNEHFKDIVVDSLPISRKRPLVCAFLSVRLLKQNQISAKTKSSRVCSLYINLRSRFTNQMRNQFQRTLENS
jgi:hypothetical protein